MDKREEQFKRMVLAYLHDPPHKVLDLGEHEEFARSFIRQVWVDRSEGAEDLRSESWLKDFDPFAWEASPDHAAAAADRVIFPNRSARTGGPFEGEIKHPLGSGSKTLDRCSVGKAEEDLQNSFGGIKAASWREFFFLLWRRWREETSKLNADLAHYPADTRIPDHSIWLHMSLTAAFEACRRSGGARLEPAFLLFQLGPVQDFIAAARSTRDLWSGSYLISWLTAHAIKAVTDEVGPSSILFPSLCGLGIFDAVNRETFEHVSYKGKKEGENEHYDTLWQRMYGTAAAEKDAAQSLFDPTIPNRVLALVPAWRAEELAHLAEQAVREELKRIGDHCFQDLEKLANKDISSWHPRWEKQLELMMPQITYQTLPFDSDLDAVIERLAKIDPAQADRMREARKLAEETIPESERDGRYYRKCDRCNEFLDRCSHPEKNWKLNHPEFAWSANFAEVSWRLAARRNTRDFAAFVTDEHQEGACKDALTGKEEAIGDEAFWETFKNSKESANSDASAVPGREDGQATPVFRDNEGPYGAMTLIKRLWCRPESDSYLAESLGIPEAQFKKFMSFKSTQDLAGEDGYFAILAMDGDEMGKWISGENEKIPRFLDQLALKARRYFKELGVSSELRRQVTPGYHLQFSEALANFSSKRAGRIVRDHEGYLIYAGGDDVLAALPAKQALACAEALHSAFCGEGWWKKILPDGRKQLFLMPGNQTGVSCGIAIAHAKYPLQRAVAEARRAEHRAKQEYNRGAFAVSLLKRGGEIIHWGANWGDGALPLFQCFQKMQQEGEKIVSNRFPYALARLLAPYQLEKGIAPEFDPHEVIKAEFKQVVANQVKTKDEEKLKELYEKCDAYLKSLKDNQRWEDFAKLFLTAAFIFRVRSQKDEGEDQA